MIILVIIACSWWPAVGLHTETHFPCAERYIGNQPQELRWGAVALSWWHHRRLVRRGDIEWKLEDWWDPRTKGMDRSWGDWWGDSEWVQAGVWYQKGGVGERLTEMSHTRLLQAWNVRLRRLRFNRWHGAVKVFSHLFLGTQGNQAVQKYPVNLINSKWFRRAPCLLYLLDCFS